MVMWALNEMIYRGRLELRLMSPPGVTTQLENGQNTDAMCAGEEQAAQKYLFATIDDVREEVIGRRVDSCTVTPVA